MAKKYIDAEKLKAEIERLKKENGKDGRPSNVAEMLYSHFLSLITSLQQEQPVVDLDKEIESFFYPHVPWGDYSFNEQEDIKEWSLKIAHHFYELGKNSK